MLLCCTLCAWTCTDWISTFGIRLSTSKWIFTEIFIGIGSLAAELELFKVSQKFTLISKILPHSKRRILRLTLNGSSLAANKANLMNLFPNVFLWQLATICGEKHPYNTLNMLRLKRSEFQTDSWYPESESFHCWNYT